jgi:hypothetical protein
MPVLAPERRVLCHKLGQPLEPREVVNKKTGEVRAILYVHTADRFIRFVAEQVPDHTWTEQQLRVAYVRVRRRREVEYWREERAKIRAMKPAELLKAIAARQVGLARNIGKKLEGRWRKRLEIADERRRELGIPLPEPKKPRFGSGGFAPLDMFAGA